ncbi:MAG: transcriptional regulator, AraC family [Chitinophagaceae bacterium]|nr:transcriptional regulator, AraC family [Chitinophagaceae bacterium]
MFNINYSHTDYAKAISEIAQAMDTKVKGDTLFIPEQFANGYFKYIPLSNGLQCMLSDYTLNQDMYMQRNSSDKEFYILRFDEISISDKLMVKIDNDYIWEEKQNRASVMLTSSLYNFAYQAAKGTAIRSINVLVIRKWLEQYLDIKSMDEVLEKYLQLKTQSYNFAPFDVEYRALFNEVMDSGNAVMQKSILENRVMMLVERFLTQLYQKLNPVSESDKIKISQDEIKRLMEVESYLIKDFSTPPPPISFLSRVAAMSTTTLKNKFKKLYGNNLYEYFQKSRMHRAKVLLMSQKYSIKEIGSQLGYSNLSNFATAFKKEFKRLPSKLGLK